MEEKKTLSQAEWKVMECLWERSPRTITQLTADLKEGTGWTKHTVISFLSRMEKKGAVRFTEGIKAKEYYPEYSKEEAAREETESFLGRVFGGKLGLMVSAMVEERTLSDGDIKELMDILEGAKGGEGGD